MKSRTFFNWLIILLGVIAITGFCFTPSFANESGDDMEIQDESFGEGYQHTWIPIQSFIPAGSGTSYITGFGYAQFLSTSNPFLRASINLPSGAYVVHARFYYYDNDADANVYCGINHFVYPDSFNQLGSFYSSGTPGYNSYYIGLNHTIRNGDGTYYIEIAANAATNQVRVGGVRLFWKRQISPAPANATFNDVSPGDWFFQGVEALAASGITVGCGGNNFCPDQAVTRAQMAVFLARALGLHWVWPY